MRKEMGLENPVLWLQIPKNKDPSAFLSLYILLCGIHLALSKGKPRLQWLRQREVCFST